MGRFDYEGDGDVYDLLAWGRQEHNLRTHLNGPKGQAILKELEEALLALPEKRLIKGVLANASQEFCTIGALAHKRGIPTERLVSRNLDGDDSFDQLEEEERTTAIGEEMKLAQCLILRLGYLNDEQPYRPMIRNQPREEETPEQRYERILDWVREHIYA